MAQLLQSGEGTPCFSGEIKGDHRYPARPPVDEPGPPNRGLKLRRDDACVDGLEASSSFVT